MEDPHHWKYCHIPLAKHELVIYCLSVLFVAPKGVFLNSAVVILATSLCQALCLQPDGSCTGVGSQSEKSYWKVHKISAGICMFESVKNAQMYLRIKDGQCDGTVSICSYFSQHMFKTFANNRHENSTSWIFSFLVLICEYSGNWM